MDVKEKAKQVQQNLTPEDKALVHEVLTETNPKEREKQYNKYVEKVTPKRSHVGNVLKAWLVGGLICCLGQFLMNRYQAMGADKELAAAYTTLSLILLSVLLTGLNWYQKLACFAGAGTVVPITGFANSVAAPAIEFKQEGWVFGVGCKIFTIAGPVILYGILSSWVLGVIYWGMKMLGVM
ncbi:MAG: stage V sporulation protein AC [Lachnospiraceae bacterium]|nr:stage V sporulation protein AC [Lachnospiraceae bacterium]